MSEKHDIEVRLLSLAQKGSVALVCKPSAIHVQYGRETTDKDKAFIQSVLILMREHAWRRGIESEG